MKKLLILLIAAISFAASVANQWSGVYVVSNSSQLAAIGHTPSSVCIATENDAVFCMESIHFNDSLFNGFRFSNLVLSADMTQEEFEVGIQKSGLTILEKEILSECDETCWEG